MSAARGTRRPHPRRVYKKARKPAKKRGGSPFCVVLIFATAAVPAAVSVITL